jgi:hypothetical protein
MVPVWRAALACILLALPVSTGLAESLAPTRDPLAAIVKGSDKKLGFMHYLPTYIVSIDGKGRYSDYGKGITIKPGAHRIEIISRLNLASVVSGMFDLDFLAGRTYRIELTPVADSPDGKGKAYDLQMFEETPQGDRMAVDLPLLFGEATTMVGGQVTTTQTIRIRKK